MASIRKRGNAFTITAYLGYDQEGKQIKKTTTYHAPEGVTPGKAEKLAKAFAATWEDQIRGYVALDENRTFAELATWYYETIAPQTLKPNVLANNRSCINNHVMPVIGREKLKNITPSMLDSLFMNLQKDGNREHHFRLKDKGPFEAISRQELIKRSGVHQTTLCYILRGKTTTQATAEKLANAVGLKLDSAFDDVTEKKGLSNVSITHMILALSAIFTAAVKKEIIRRNPCSHVTQPKNDSAPAAYLDEDQCRKLLDIVSAQKDFQFEVIVNLLLASGMRSGELSALYWEDIDFDTGMVYIRHTLVRVGSDRIRQDPKTKGSTRRIVLPEYIIGLLKKHRIMQATRMLKMGSRWVNPNLVFTNTQGDYYLGTNMNSKLKRVIAGTDLPQNLHLHSLRHTHASLLINSDVTARVIADRLGHAKTSTTLNIYSHVFAESEAKAMQAIDMALFRKAR